MEKKKEIAGKELLDKLDDLYNKARKLGSPAVYDKELAYGMKLGQVKGHQAEQIQLMTEAKELDMKINGMLESLHRLHDEVEDISLSLANSFQTEYGCGMFYKGWAYQAKFIGKSEHWSVENAKEAWKKQYDDCVKYFKILTKGLDTHNFTIIVHDDGSNAVFKFTVSGIPGDFEIFMPLNSSEYFVKNSRLKAKKPMMSMGLAWRRNWIIPFYDYFFDGFGAYTAEKINAKLHEFISSKKYEEFCNTKTYIKKHFDSKTLQEITKTCEYSEEDRKYLEKELLDEIEKNSKEGKYLE